MTTITSVASNNATSKLLASAGDVLTISGSGFGSTAGTVACGETALTDVTWGATSLTGTLPAECPLGLYDVIVTPDGGSAVSAPAAVFVCGGDSGFHVDQVRLGKLARLYVDGQHIGYCEDSVSIDRKFETKDFKPNDRNAVVKTFTVGVDDTIKFTIAQVNGPNLALVFSGRWDAVRKTVTLTGDDQVGEHSVAWVDAAGVAYVFPRCQLIDPPGLTLNATDTVRFPLTMRVLAADTAGENVGYIAFP